MAVGWVVLLFGTKHFYLESSTYSTSFNNIKTPPVKQPNPIHPNLAPQCYIRLWRYYCAILFCLPFKMQSNVNSCQLHCSSATSSTSSSPDSSASKYLSRTKTLHFPLLLLLSLQLFPAQLEKRKRNLSIKILKIEKRNGFFLQNLVNREEKEKFFFKILKFEKRKRIWFSNS